MRNCEIVECQLGTAYEIDLASGSRNTALWFHCDCKHSRLHSCDRDLIDKHAASATIRCEGLSGHLLAADNEPQLIFFASRCSRQTLRHEHRMPCLVECNL